MRKFAFAFLIFSFLLAVFIPGIIKENKLVLGGSTSVYSLFGVAKKNPNYKKIGFELQYISIGSSAALKRVQDNIFDVGFVSRRVSSNIPSDIVVFTVARDFLIMVYHLPSGCKLLPNRSKALAINPSQLAQVFTKPIAKWSSLRPVLAQNYSCTTQALNSKIIRINREAGSGTRQSFESFFKLDERYWFENQVSSSNQLIKTLKSQPGTITYASLPFIDQTMIKDHSSLNQRLGLFVFDGLSQIFAKSATKIIDYLSEYQFTRPFQGFYRKKKYNKVKPFLDFLQSASFQTMLKNNRYGHGE